MIKITSKTVVATKKAMEIAKKIEKVNTDIAFCVKNGVCPECANALVAVINCETIPMMAIRATKYECSNKKCSYIYIPQI